MAYGTWRSPITSDLIVSETVGLADIVIAGRDLYWLEIRPQEQGRSVIVCRTSEGAIVDVTPASFSARSAVHEYGGGSFTVHEQTVYFTNFEDQRVYRQSRDGSPEPLTATEDVRYADLTVAPDGKGMVAVREDHREPGKEASNTLVWLDLETEGPGRVLVEGMDFYASPRFHPHGKHLAWLAWSHPDMPWDGTELWMADVSSEGSLSNARKIAGGTGESIFQPEWSPGGDLYFVSDRTGWWNLYGWNNEQVKPLCLMEAEFGQPQWVFGMASFGIESPDGIVAFYQEEGRSHLARIDLEDGEVTEIPTPHTQIAKVQVDGDQIVYLGGSPERQTELVRIDTSSGALEVVRRSSSLEIDEEFLSRPESIRYPTTGGAEAFAFFYPPRNGTVVAPEGERPPLLVLSHGGPTSATETTLSPRIQYWTSRGIAVVDVNYGGSTGYGRAYRERLKGQWGVVDVSDCENAVKYLAQQGKIDPERVAIRGGSAGGFTTLCALTFRDSFRAGASYYGVSDLEILARDTHKFESRYLDSLIGPYPQEIDLYKSRSPIYAVDRLTCAVIFFQGLEDRIVPPNQAELMYEAVLKAGFPTAYVAFEGEDHGFRKAENIKRSLDGELYFYGRVFGFEPAGEIEGIKIDNL
jgi:dipeptidyl aminopeptidase/acylaminoacyl peptidase